MKEGWTYKKLGEVCEKSNKINWNKITEDKSYVYIDLSSVDRETLSIMTPQIIDKSNAPSRAKQIVKTGDVIFATTRPTLRRTSMISKKYNNQICSTGFCVLRPQKEVLTEWVFYNLQYDGFYTYIEPLQAGASYPAVTDSVVKDYVMKVPPLPEQQSIVDYLDSAFAKIDAMKANAEKALNEAKALFQASLKKMLEPKEGWEEKKLINEFSLKSGDNLSAKNQVKGPYPVYGGNGITGFHNQYNLSGEQILIGRVGALCGNIHYVKENIWVTDNSYVVNDISGSWNMLFLSYELEYIDLNKYASQTAQPVISNKSMKDVSIFLPSLSEQQSIVSTLNSLKSKVDRLQANFDKISQECDALKQAILRQVFE